MAKSKIKAKTKTETDDSFHPYSLSISVENKEKLDELISFCQERGLYYMVHDYNE